MTDGFRALLIGVPTYVDDAIDDLPFVETDLAELAAALQAAGYEIEVHDPGHTNREAINYAVEDFTRRSRPRQTLLIYLSGHGVHHEGMDYLVPSSARVGSRNFPGQCVPIDFNGHIERSRAGDVVVFVDACREGLVLLEMAAVNTASWSRRRVVRMAGRRVAYVYACAAGERARYARAGTTAFSLFSRGLSQVLAAGDRPATLAGLRAAVQDVVDALTAEHELPHQRVHILGETDPSGFLVCPRTGGGSPVTDRETRSVNEGSTDARSADARSADVSSADEGLTDASSAGEESTGEGPTGEGSTEARSVNARSVGEGALSEPPSGETRTVDLECVDEELRNLPDVLDRLEERFAEGRRLATEALDRFVDPEGLQELTDPDWLSDSGRGLRPWLSDLQAAARAGPGRNKDVGYGIRGWQKLAAATEEVARRLVAANGAPMRYFSELRGRQRSHEAKAASLGLAEDEELSVLRSSARAALARRPVDLRLAEKRVHAYEDAVNNRDGGSSGLRVAGG